MSRIIYPNLANLSKNFISFSKFLFLAWDYNNHIYKKAEFKCYLIKEKNLEIKVKDTSKKLEN